MRAMLPNIFERIERWSQAAGRPLYDFFTDPRAQAGLPGGSMSGEQLLRVVPPSVYAMPDFRAFQAELRGYNEIVRWPLYHYRAYAAGGQTQLTYFDQTEGSATLGRADTNMKVQGSLPGNEMQLVYAIRVVPFPAFADVTVIGVVGGTAFQEWYRALSNGCWLEMVVSDKEYMVGAPLFLFPQGMGPGSLGFGSGIALSNNASMVNNGHPSNEALFKMDPPIGILPTRPFKVTLNWRAVQAVTTAGRLGVILDGWKLRSVQ